tara:strand:- start:470 stop:814 length:345 start_codon:yes stop_codon:yes gene_type:complete
MPIIIKSKRDGDDDDASKRKAQSRFAHQTKLRKPTESPSPFKPLPKFKSKEPIPQETGERIEQIVEALRKHGKEWEKKPAVEREKLLKLYQEDKEKERKEKRRFRYDPRSDGLS